MNGVRGPAIATIVLGVLAGVVSWVVGMGPIESVLVASVIVILGAGQVVRAKLEPEPPWPQPQLGARRLGTRREVEQLRWTLTGRRRVIPEHALRRLQAVAEHRLARHGVDLNDPAHGQRAAALLGAPTYSVLIADPSQPVDHAAFERCVTALERLDDLTEGAMTNPAGGTDGRR